MSRKWGFYDCDIKILNWAFGVDGSLPVGLEEAQSRKTLEAQIMDWADDIAYAVHDIEDFFRGGVIPLAQLTNIRSGISFREFALYMASQREHLSQRLASIASEWEEYLIHHDQPGFEQEFGFLRMVEGTFRKFPAKRFTGSGFELRDIMNMRTNLIEYFSRSVVIDGNGNLEFSDEHCHDLNETIKQLVWYYVIDSPGLLAVQEGQSSLIKSLFNHYYSALKHAWSNSGFDEHGKYARHLPRRLVDFARIAWNDASNGEGSYGDSGDLAIRSSRARAVVDFVSSLTEDQTYFLGARLLGSTGVQRITNRAL